MKILINNILKFILLTIIQVFFLKNLSLYGVTIPYLYILFIILLPNNTPYFLVYLSSFLLGFIIDMFLNSPGIHTSTCIITAFVRIIILNFINSYDEKSERNVANPSYKKDSKAFFIYSLILVVVHGVTLSILEVASFSNFLVTLKNSLYSILITLSIIMMIHYLFRINQLKTGK